MNGYVESLASPISWARRIEEIIEDSQKQKDFGTASKDIMREYTIENMADDYMDAIRELMLEGKNL